VVASLQLSTRAAAAAGLIVAIAQAAGSCFRLMQAPDEETTRPAP
jgi:hypothetical protein